MATQESDTSGETPDMSLGSISLNATGEQLEDIQANFDRMYLDSPAPSSLSASMVESVVMPSSTDGDNLAVRRPASASRPTLSDQDGFDRLSLIDLEDVAGALETIDWLTLPSSELPAGFSEDDRSFLDTNLLNRRFNLLNYVTRAINEENYAELRGSQSARSNLLNEAAGSGATVRITRPFGKCHTSVLNAKDTSGFDTANGSTRESGNDYFPLANQTITRSRNFFNTDLAARAALHPAEAGVNQDLNGSEMDDTNNTVSSRNDSNISNGSRTFVRRRSSQDTTSNLSSQSLDRINVAFIGEESMFSSSDDTPRETLIEEATLTDVSDMGTDSSASNSARVGCVTHMPINLDITQRINDIRRRVEYNGSPSRSQHPAETGSNVDTDPLPFVSTISSGTIRLGVSRLHGRVGDIRFAGIGVDQDDLSGDDGSGISGSLGREIDSRTYTRPRKARMSIGTPSRQLNTTMTVDESPRQIGQSPLSPHHPLNTTINLTPEIECSDDASENTPNLNETFDANDEMGFHSTSERARRVTRNKSYVIRRDEESPNNNSSRQSHSSPSTELNNTFSYDPETDAATPGTKGSQNTSMEDLNSRVASQIRSLGCSTIASRARVADHAYGRGGSNLEDAHIVARTSSTDTYSVAHSSESPTSSGLSSPMDAQSYDDIQSGEAVRRSMPNLAAMRNASALRSNLAFPQAGSGQLRKNHYISDSRLSRLGTSERPRLSMLPTDSPQYPTYTRAPRVTRGRIPDRNTSTPTLNRPPMSAPTPRVYSAQTLGSNSSRPIRTEQSPSRPQASSANVRATGFYPPRLPAAASGLRPPRATGAAQSGSRNAGVPGIPVPTFRAQSRIPAPGQLRFGRPAPSASGRALPPSRPGASSRGPTADDWRDGCY